MAVNFPRDRLKKCPDAPLYAAVAIFCAVVAFGATYASKWEILLTLVPLAFFFALIFRKGFLRLRLRAVRAALEGEGGEREKGTRRGPDGNGTGTRRRRDGEEEKEQPPARWDYSASPRSEAVNVSEMTSHAAATTSSTNASLRARALNWLAPSAPSLLLAIEIAK